MLKKLSLLLSCSLLVSCNNVVSKSDSLNQSYPKTWEERQYEDMGKLTGPEGITLFGGSGFSKSDATGITVNSYLWRASLDIIHKMPLQANPDPFSGVIITDWYKVNQDSKERFKFNIFILGAELRSDAVKVSVFKQVINKGTWEDVFNNEKLATEIENKILLKARAIKYRSK